ncbi:MAG: ABC transporter transmembrane domain-containing protein [Verrucomicrobiota bacterium]
MSKTADKEPNAAEGKTGEGKKKSRRLSLKEILWLFSYLKPYQRWFWPAIFCMFFTAGLSLVWPFMISKLIGGSVAAGEIDVASVKQNLGSYLKITLAALSLQAFLVFWRIRWFTKAGESALAEIRKQTYGKLIRLPMPYYDEHRVGEMSSRIASDLTLIRETLINTVPQIVRQSVMLIGGTVMVFASSTKLALLMLLGVPVIMLMAAIFGRGIRKLTRQSQDLLAETNVVVEETLQSITSVKSFGNEAYETRRYGVQLDRFLDMAIRAATPRGLFIAFIIFALFGVMTIVLWYGGIMLVNGEIDSELFWRFVLFSVFVGAALGSFPEIISQLQQAVGASDRVREILGEDTESVDGADGQQRLQGAVALDQVSFHYPARPDVGVLKGVSLKAEPGERVALVGPSGAGKSTIISLLLRFYDPSSGKVVFDGKDAESYDLSYLRSQMALVPQEVLLFGGSILENIAYGNPDAERAAIEDAAQRANAHEFIEAFPEGYETLVGDRGVRLSGGQRQRIAIARAILADPAILILDEATSSLDAESERVVQEALEALMKGRTSIIIAHRLATVKDADRIVVIKDGMTVQTGTHDELIAETDGMYRMLAQLQFVD